ncbi:ROK family protein [Kitasatospora sp. NPDC058965]|uniref:ROK family transcriptional regulator n=1 Tax=Kitasatospora sp. NPDC058965 TaxID=3346682 RepID=UPI0036B3BD92
MTAAGAEWARPALHGQARRRAAHRARVLRSLRCDGPAIRQELASRTALSTTTVSSLLAELEHEGLITQQAVRHGGTGRRPVLVSFNRDAGTALAVDVGPDRLAVAVGSRPGGVLAECRVPLPAQADPQGADRVLSACAERALAEAGTDPETLVGVTVALSMPPRAGSDGAESGASELLWAGAAHRTVGARWRIPVTVERGARLGALAEYSRGGAAGAHSIVNITHAGAAELGVAIDGTLLRGHSGRAGRLGHLLVRPDGRTCRCGRRGCLDAYLTPAAPLQLSGRAPDDLPDDGRLARFAEAVAAAAALIDPSVIVLGGALASEGERLEAPLRRALSSVPFRPAVPVVRSTLGDRAPLLGGLDLALAQPRVPVEPP